MVFPISLARLYDTEIGAVLERLVPQRTVTCRRRPSDPCFDQECRDAKRRVRRLERVSSRASRAATADPVSAKVAEAAACRRCLDNRASRIPRSSTPET